MTTHPRPTPSIRRLLPLLAAGTLAALAAPSAAGAQQRAGSDDPLPLEPARSLPMDLREGTWMSVDVTPDGRTVVFDLLGDLFTVPIGGGDARQLTSGMAFDGQPRVSPDGQWVAFTSDRSGGQNIWIMRMDGTDTVQISRGDANRAESPEWTPDGEYIVASMGGFRGGGLPKLHLYHRRGGGGAQLIDEPQNLKTLGPAFGDDGRWIWYARRTGDWNYNAQLPQYQLAVYDRDTGESFTRTSRYGSAFRPTLSPDGRWLVYGTRHETETGLVLRDLDTGEERWLAYPVQHDDQESRATLDVLPGMSFTPDSRELVASWDGRLWRVPVAGGDAVEIPFRARFDLPVGPVVEFDYPIEDSPTFTVRQIRDAVPSPDGRRLAFVAMDRLWVSDADGSNPRRVTDGDDSEHHPAWSPDGAWIAYVTWEGTEGHLYKVRPDGSGRVRLSRNAGIYADPAWAPDGTRLVATRGHGSSYRLSGSNLNQILDDLVQVSADGGGESLIAPVGDYALPHFRRDDPDRIYLSMDDGRLASIRWDGTDERVHVRVRGWTPEGSDEPLDADRVMISPTGREALAQVERHLYTVTVPRTGGEEPVIRVGDPDNAAFPARRLTRIGGEFPAWGPDGATVHWSLGNAHFVYDLARSDAVRDSLEDARAARDEDEADEDADDDEGRYEPAVHRIEIRAERDLPNGVAVLRGGRAVTMDGQEVIENADIVVRDNRIEAVGARGSVSVPAGAEVIDVSGHTVVPGFVDTHAHMRPQRGVHRRDQWMYLANLAYGVTTTRDPQTGVTDVLSYADLVRSGEILGPRIFSTGPGVFWQDDIGTIEEARDILRNYSDYYGTNTLKMYVAGTRKARQLIIQAARELRIMPTTEGSLNFRQNVTETVDGYSGLEHSLPIYPVYDDVVQLFAEMRRAYTPTLLVSYGGPWAENYWLQNENPHDDPKFARFTPHEALDAMTRRRSQWFLPEEYVFEDHARFVADLVAAGGRAGVGSHGGGDLRLQGLGYHWELWSMASGGLSNHDALAVATIHGARAIGLDQDVGSIEAGKLADLVVLRENPLDDLRHTNTIRYVMLNGRLYDGDTLAETWPRQRELPEPWWWSTDPDPAELPGVGR